MFFKSLSKSAEFAHSPVTPVLPLEEGCRSHVFPPDFLHGNAELDELYGSFQEWAERFVFVRPVVVEGVTVAMSIARFDDWFLTVEHRVGSDLDEVEGQWDEVTVIELALDGTTRSDRDHWIVVACDRTRFEELEQGELDVTRDLEMSETAWWQTAQTDLLSLVCLTARLGRLH